jgi:hypothetical protein
MPVADVTETLKLVRDALGKGIMLTPDDLQKAGITVASGLIAYDLRAPALSLIPVITPIRNKLPRVKGKGGDAIHWKAITGINTGQLSLGVSEGNRSGVITTATKDYLAAYRVLGLENFITFEADEASEGFMDAKADAALQLLRAVMIGEERVLYGGNTSLPLGTTPTPTLTTATTGGSIATGTTVSVIAVALTPDGYRRASLANGVVASLTRTNADGTSDTVGAGAAQKSANATVATGAGNTNSVTATVATVPGAVAYAWFAGTAGNERIVAITTINSVVITALPGSGQLASALPAADNSTDALVYDGLLTYAMNAVNGGYYKALSTGTPGTGSKLTADGAGGVKEFTDAFRFYWDTYRLSPTHIWVSAQEMVNLAKILVDNNGAAIVRVNVDASGKNSSIAGGYRVESVLNPITNRHVAVDVHPDAVPGTVLFEVEEIPYPLNNVRNVKEIDFSRDYWQVEWPLRSRKYEYGVYTRSVLRVSVPFTLGVITNIAG